MLSTIVHFKFSWLYVGFLQATYKRMSNGRWLGMWGHPLYWSWRLNLKRTIVAKYWPIVKELKYFNNSTNEFTPLLPLQKLPTNLTYSNWLKYWNNCVIRCYLNTCFRHKCSLYDSNVVGTSCRRWRGRTSTTPQINQSTRTARRGVGYVSLCFKFVSFLKALNRQINT